MLTLRRLHLFQVKKASVMYDPHTRESRGFGFVTMESAEEADAAITALNGTELMGKIINVEKVTLFFTFLFCYLQAHKINDKARRVRARTPTPGRYQGPPKRTDCEFLLIVNNSISPHPLVLVERPYDPRPYDSRYSREHDDRRGGGGRGGRYDDRRGGGRAGRDSDRPRDRGDRDRDRGGYGRDRYDDRR